MRPRFTRVTALACLFVVGCTAAACGVPVGGPQAIQVPTVLLQGPPKHIHEQNPCPATAGSQCSTFLIFFIQGDHLFPVDRQGVASSKDLLTHLLTQLEAGPLTSEVGLTTAIEGGAVATIVKVKGQLLQPHGVVTVNLGLSFGYLSTIGFAQIVYTIMQLHGAQAVLFDEDGSQIATPVGNGTVVIRSVTKADYTQYAPAYTTPT